jgi:hypothetical protein
VRAGQAAEAPKRPTKLLWRTQPFAAYKALGRIGWAVMFPGSSIQGEELLRLVMFGHRHFQSLWAGVELGVFELISEKGSHGAGRKWSGLHALPERLLRDARPGGIWRGERQVRPSCVP